MTRPKPEPEPTEVEVKHEPPKPEPEVGPVPPEANPSPEQLENSLAEDLKERGNAFYKKKKFDEAIECYNEAIELNPIEMNYFGNKVAVLTVQKKFEEAHKVLQEAFDKYNQLEYKDKDFAKIVNSVENDMGIDKISKGILNIIRHPASHSQINNSDYLNNLDLTY